MEILEVQNPTYANLEHTAVNLEVRFAKFSDVFLPFTAVPDDVEEHGRILYENAIAGEYGPIGEYEPPAPPPATEPQPVVNGAQTL